MIPAQLHNSEFRFIKVAANSKQPIERNWQADANYPFDSPSLRDHLARGGNYGIICGPGKIRILDCDDMGRLEELGVLAKFPKTFSVQSRPGRIHRYYMIPEMKKKITLFDPFLTDENGQPCHLGEIQGPGTQIIGPGSIHVQTGKPYEVIDDSPIAALSLDQVHNALDGLKTSRLEANSKKLDAMPKRAVPHKEDDAFKHIKIDDIAHPVGDTGRIGDEIQGAHPVHGSTTGKNFRIDLKKNTWYCDRCHTGGGPALWLAVQHDIIRCDEAAIGALRGDKFLKVLRIAEREGIIATQKPTFKKLVDKAPKEDKKPLEPQPLNNRGNVERLLYRHNDDLKYCREFKDWIHWNGRNWQRDETAPYTALDDVVESIYEEARQCESDEQRKKIATFAAVCGSNTNYQATVALASKNPAFSVSVLDLDADDCKMNLQNGVLDLEAFELYPHDPSFMLMKTTNFSFDATAKCERWEQFLDEVFEHKQSMKEYIQRVLGYSLTGSMAEKCFFFLFGAEGDNGKSVFLDLVRALGGEYSRNCDISTFLTSKNEKVRDDLAALYGARIITTAEPEEGRRFAMEVIKPWTGGDPQTCRELYGKIFTYQPKGKIFLAANNKPAIYERTSAAWARVHLIPFNRTFAKEEQDKGLSQKLKKELPGILNWALAGLKDYRALGGLYPPKEIRDAVNEYRKDNDSVRVFVDDVCTFSNRESNVDGPILYAAYKEFCLNSGLKPLGLGKFNGAMLDACVLKGVVREKRSTGYVWTGLTVPHPRWSTRLDY